MEQICSKCGKPLRPMPFGISSGSSLAISSNDTCFCNLNIKIESEVQDFEFFIECLRAAYKEFLLNQRMHEQIKTGLYRKLEKQWNVVLISLEMDYKLWLAKFLEESYAPDCLKGFAKEGSKNGTDVWKIMNWRNNFLAHFSTKTLREWTKFHKENDLDDESLKNLFSKILEIVKQYNNKEECIPNLEESFIQLEKDALAECDKWLDNFKEA